MLIIDSVWRDNTTSGFDSGILVWKDDGDNPYFLRLQPKEYISWTILGPKRCIGSRNITGDLTKCPENSVVSKNKQRCGPCSAVDVYDPCIRCTGQSCNASEDRAKKCARTDYVVYLVLFNDKSLKVGVSVKHRVLTRWVEQGADYGIIITEVTGGMKARNIENNLSKNKQLRKSVHPSRKANGISEELAYSQAKEFIQNFKESLDKSSFDFDLHFGELTKLAKYYSLDEMDAKPSQWFDSKTRIDGKQIFGHVVGMKGTFLVTKIKNAYSIINLHRLIGYKIDSEKEIKAVTQSGLLDYL